MFRRNWTFEEDVQPCGKFVARSSDRNNICVNSKPAILVTSCLDQLIGKRITIFIIFGTES